MILACCLAGILISGVLSRVVLTGIDLKFDLPEHIFAEQPVLAEIELRNEKQTVAVLFAARHWRDQGRLRPKFSRGPYFSPIFRD